MLECLQGEGLIFLFPFHETLRCPFSVMCVFVAKKVMLSVLTVRPRLVWGRGLLLSEK